MDTLTLILSGVVIINGLITAAAPVMQLRRIHSTHSARDVSLEGLALLWLSFLIWTLYALVIKNFVIFSADVIPLATASATFVIAWRYRHHIPLTEISTERKLDAYRALAKEHGKYEEIESL